MRDIQFIQISKEELQEVITSSIQNQFKAIKEHLKPKTQNSYLTRKDVAEMLKIDISSVHNYSKKGLLKPYQIGGRVYFKLEEVENAIVKLKK